MQTLSVSIVWSISNLDSIIYIIWVSFDNKILNQNIF